MGTFGLVKVNHINAMVDGYQPALDHFGAVLGFQVNMQIPDQGDGVQACLMNLGGVMFELFAPRERTERGQGKLLATLGPHYMGIEYQVTDVPVAREVSAAKDVRIINDPGHFFFTYPGSFHGVSWELWDGDWHVDRPEGRGWSNVLPAAHWREEHPLGVTGLARLSLAVADLDAAVARFTDVAGATVLDRVERQAAVATGVDLQVGDAVWELLTPTGEGPVSAHLDRYGDRIRSTVFRVADLGRAEKHLAGKGIALVPGDADDALAIPPEQNCGLLFELTE